LSALIAAVCFAFSAVLQQASAHSAPRSESLRPRLLWDLARRRSWLAGVGLMILAYALESLALALGDVTVVEPVVITELVFALAIGARRKGRRVGRREWVGVACVVGGVSAFLVTTGTVVTSIGPPPPVREWLLALLPCAGFVAVTLALSRRAGARAKAGLLAAGAGVAFGVLAVLTRVSVGIVERTGPMGLLEQWEPYVLLVLGVGGFLLSQSAYQAAPLSSSLPVIDTCEPVAAVVIAAALLGEPFGLGTGALVLEALGAALAIIGVFLLGGSPVVIATYQVDQLESDPAPASPVSPSSTGSPACLGQAT